MKIPKSIGQWLDGTATILVILVCVGLGVNLVRGWMYKPRIQAAQGDLGSKNETLPAAPVSTTGRFSEGAADAPLVLVVFSDFLCEYCGRFSRETLPRIRKQYVEPGELRVVFWNVPTHSRHPLYTSPASAAQCAGQQGRFWRMHDRIFEEQQALSNAHLRTIAESIGLDMRLFEECLRGEATVRVIEDLKAAQQWSITGTPTFLVGKFTQNGVRVVRRFAGAVGFDRFEAELRAAAVARPNF